MTVSLQAGRNVDLSTAAAAENLYSKNIDTDGSVKFLNSGGIQSEKECFHRVSPEQQRSVEHRSCVASLSVSFPKCWAVLGCTGLYWAVHDFGLVSISNMTLAQTVRSLSRSSSSFCVGRLSLFQSFANEVVAS